jgi:tRNA splicing endonuclease
VQEEHEVKVLPCLARNAPIASLIDLLYLEEHSNAYRLQATYARLRAHGVVVETGWP